MTNQQREMMEYTTQDMIAFLMEDYGLSMDAAMDTVFASDTLQKLWDFETGLYHFAA